MSGSFHEASEHQNESMMTSELDPEPEIPWLKSFYLRCGVDALTGVPKVSALKRPTVPNKSLPNHGPPKTDFMVKIIRGVHQQWRMHKFKGRGTVNPMSPLALNASFAVQTSHSSSNHLFLVETIVSGEYDFEKLDLEVLELTSEALALSKTPGEFRKRHGDYFVLGSKNRYWFHALVECRSNRVDDVRTIEASAEIAWRDILGLHGQAESSSGGFKFDLNATAWISYSGCDIPTTGGGTESPAVLSVTCKDVIQMAKSILAKEQPGWKEIALLAPYSRVFPTFPNTVPVSREVFDMLHNLEAIALGLQYDCLHPAFARYENIVSDTRTVVERFGTQRASFIANTGSTNLEDARRSLEDAAGKVRSVLVRYRFMEELAKKWRGKPQIDEKFEERAADQKWTHGVVSTDAGDTFQVPLTDGTMAFHGEIEVTTRKIIPKGQKTLRFEYRELESYRPGQGHWLQSSDPSTLIHSGQPCYIVGWTLSCRTKQPGPKTFSVKRGGILESHLRIDVEGPYFRQTDWRCRIYFVESEDYNFPDLNLGW